MTKSNLDKRAHKEQGRAMSNCDFANHKLNSIELNSMLLRQNKLKYQKNIKNIN